MDLIQEPAQTPVTRIGFVGSGHIAGPYAVSILRHPELQLVGVFDVDRSKADRFADDHNCHALGSLAELVERVDIVVNLTSAPYHFETTRQLVELGAAVFSEKPLALTAEQARTLVRLATDTGVRVGCAPSLWLGRACMEAASRIRADEVGAVRLVTAEVHQGRIETWHPAPHTFYQVGPVVDAGVYPLTYLTAVLGPIRSVTATSARLMPARVTTDGEAFEIATADAWYVTAAFESGQLLRLSCDFYIAPNTVARSIEFHGDAGSLRLDDWIAPDAVIERAGYGEAYEPEPVPESIELDWSLGVLDLARAIAEDRPHRNSLAHAAHVVEILEAIEVSAATGSAVEVQSTFPSPFEQFERVQAS